MYDDLLAGIGKEMELMEVEPNDGLKKFAESSMFHLESFRDEMLIITRDIKEGKIKCKMPDYK